MSAYQLKIATAGRPGRVQADRCGVLDLSQEALKSVWNEIAPELYRLICAMGISGDRVEDILQDVYLVSHQKSPKKVENADLRRWLFRVTANRCNLEHRRQRRWRVVWANVARIWPVATDHRDAENAASHDEQRRLIQDALDALPPPLRSVLVLRYFSDFNSKEIGSILELPDSTVRSHLRRAATTGVRTWTIGSWQ